MNRWVVVVRPFASEGFLNINLSPEILLFKDELRQKGVRIN